MTCRMIAAMPCSSMARISKTLTPFSAISFRSTASKAGADSVTSTSAAVGPVAKAVGAKPKLTITKKPTKKATGKATVSVSARASSTIASVPTGARAVTDKDPSAALIDMGSRTVAVGQTVAPLVRAKDDFAVKSATLLANGWPVATTSTAPYTFSWTATPGFAGQDVVFATIVTDSAGHTTRSASATVSVEKGAGTPPANPAPPTGVFTPTLKIKEIVKKPSKGRSTVYATVNTAGKVSITGSKVATDSVRTRRASTVKITLKPNKAQRKILNRRGSVTVTFKLSFKAESGGTVTQTRTVVIKKR